MALLEIRNLEVSYRKKVIVTGVNFSLERGKCTAIIGESGSGKSVTSSTIGRILPENLSISGGEVFFDGKNIASIPEAEMREIRGSKIAYIFQDYQGEFTPFIKVGKQFHETISCHIKMDKAKAKELILEKIASVGLEAERIYRSYPFQMSGGQLQRCAIAQAMLLQPDLLIADEPTTALDSVSTSNVLQLMEGIKKESNCAVLFISHDLRTVKKYADNLVIMYKGHVVESGKTEEVIADPKHIYTQNLFASIPPLRKVPKRLPLLQIPENVDLKEIVHK